MAPLAAHGASARGSFRAGLPAPAPACAHPEPGVVDAAGDSVRRGRRNRDLARRPHGGCARARSFLAAQSQHCRLRERRRAGSSARPHAVHRAGDPVYTGLGFDACTAPCEATMWLEASPFRAVGDVHRGREGACAQPNLTPAWVAQESVAGWALMPTYVGLQAPEQQLRVRAVSCRAGGRRGDRGREDAVEQAEAEGMRPATRSTKTWRRPTGRTRTREPLLAFLSPGRASCTPSATSRASTAAANSGIIDLIKADRHQLHRARRDLVRQLERRDVRQQRGPTSDWAKHQRLHQYPGARTPPTAASRSTSTATTSTPTPLRRRRSSQTARSCR